MLSQQDKELQAKLKSMNEASALEVLASKNRSLNANVSKVIALIEKAKLAKRKTLAITSQDLNCDTFSIATIYSALRDTQLAKKNESGNKISFVYPVKFFKASDSVKNSNIIACVIGIE